MPEIQSPDPGRKLAQRYNLLGPDPAPTLAPEIVPVTVVDDISAVGIGTADILSAATERPCVGSIRHTPTLGERAIISLINEPGSGVLCITEDMALRFASTTSSTAQFRILTLANLGVADRDGIEFRDSRLPGAPALGWHTRSDVIALEQTWDIKSQGDDSTLLYPFGYVLAPGSRLECRCQVIDVTPVLSIRWRERDITGGI